MGTFGSVSKHCHYYHDLSQPAGSKCKSFFDNFEHLRQVQDTPSALRREAWLLRVRSWVFGLWLSGPWCGARLLLRGSKSIALWKVEKKLGSCKVGIAEEQEF